MKNSIQNIALLIISLLTISCAKEFVRGEGPVETIDRTAEIISDFNTIRINGGADVYVRYGTERKVEIKGYPNLLPLFATDIRHNKLILEFKEGYRIKNDNIKVYLTLPTIPNIEINGSCHADFTGNFPASEALYAEINGSGKISYSVVDIFNARFSINGSGNIHAQHVHSTQSYVRISGSGEVKLTVSDKLKVDISGSGQVYYQGRPIVEQQISGSGKIISL